MSESMQRPSREWVANLLLAGQLLFPGIVWTIGLLTETPARIDWAAESLPARATDALLYAHVLYAVILVVVMRGWRLQAVVFGVFALVVSAVTNFIAYFKVTGVYW
jgi:hypothetical protein